MDKFVNVAEPVVGDEEKDEVEDVIDSGHFLQGPRVQEFEEKWSDYVGVEHAIAVANGTVAIQLSLNALGLEPGEEVIVPSLTFGSTATAVVHQAGVPVFADIDEETYSLDPDDLERCLSDETRAILPVHLYGHPAEMDEINEFAEKHDLYVIEDAAQAHGASYRGEKVGSIGDVGTFSFYATKNITTGEGGIVTTDDDEVAETVRKLRSHGMGNRDEHELLGFNYRLGEMNGALGTHQVDRLDELNRRRREISYNLFDELGNLDWLTPAEVEDHVEHAFFWAPFRVEEDVIGMTGKEVWRKLKDEGVETRHRYVDPLYDQPVFKEHRGFNSDFPWSANPNKHDYDLHLPNVEEISGAMIGLPNHPKLSDEDVEFVVETVKNFDG
ncbi:MAG: DegT/DnrJ/EryC1/StrS family aminotransferase [Halobacteria archaeon]